MKLDSSKHLDHSFERLIRSTRPQSPFQREFTSSYRDIHSSVRDISSSARDIPLLSIRKTPVHSSAKDIRSAAKDFRLSALDIPSSFTRRIRSISTRDFRSSALDIPYTTREYRSPIREYRSPAKEYRSPIRNIRSSAKDFNLYSSYKDIHLSARDIRSSTRDVRSSARDIRSSARDIHSSYANDYVKDYLKDFHRSKTYSDSTEFALPYRSKSYHGDLSRLHTSSHSLYGSHLSRYERSMSKSAHDLDDQRGSLSSLTSSHMNVNAYSRHHSHHNHQPLRPPSRPQMTSSRSRFHSRSAYKNYRSRSANPPDRQSRTHSPIRPISTSTIHSSMIRDYQSPLTRSQLEIRKPIFSTKLRERTVTEHSAVRLSCNILNPDSYVRWLKNKRELEEQNSRYRNIYRNGTAMLEIYSARGDDSGEYTCIARNRFGENSCSSRLSVVSSSKWRSTPPIFTSVMKGKKKTLLKRSDFFKTTNKYNRFLDFSSRKYSFSS